MKIVFLYNHREYLYTVSNWIFKEFVKKSKSKATLEQVVDFFGNANITTFPMTLIAIKNGKCLGTVSIFENDLKTQTELTPWLASLYISPEHRNQCIAEKLMNTAMKNLKDLGYKSLYLRTELADKYYEKRGWNFLHQTFDEYGQETKVYKYNL